MRIIYMKATKKFVYVKPAKFTVFAGIPENGRGGGSRTPSRWFWKPVLCQLSYTPVLPETFAANNSNDIIVLFGECE